MIPIIDTIDYRIKSPISGTGYIFWNYWSVGSHETSLLYAIAFNFGYPLGHDDKTTSMKTPHRCVTEHEETKLALTRSFTHTV